MSVIQLDDVTKSYQVGEVETHALNGVSLNIEQGEFTALVGPSGSGKTTMLQLMGCLDKPDTGDVKINGQDVINLNANQRADISTENISTTGFDIVFKTWGDTKIARVRAAWFAIGEFAGDEEWELY